MNYKHINNKKIFNDDYHNHNITVNNALYREYLYHMYIAYICFFISFLCFVIVFYNIFNLIF